MKLLILSAIVALLAAVGFAHHGHLILHDLEEVAKLPREKWGAALQTILDKRKARNPIDDAILALLERLRETMPVGIPSLGIPPLDPYHVVHYDLDLTNSGVAPIRLIVDDCTVDDLSKFIINKVANDLENLKADYDFVLPTLSAVGKYNLSGHIPGAFDLFGDGPFTAELTNMRAWGTVRIGSVGNSLDGTVFLNSIDIDFELEALKVNFENLMGGGTIGDMLNEIISTSGPEMLQQYKPQVVELLSSAVKNIGNPILGQFTLREILDYLGVPHPV